METKNEGLISPDRKKKDNDLVKKKKDSDLVKKKKDNDIVKKREKG